MNETESGFETSQNFSSSTTAEQPKSAMARLIMRTGFVQTEAAANNIAIAIAVACFVIAGYLLFGGSTPIAPSQVPAVGTIGPNGIPQP